MTDWVNMRFVGTSTDLVGIPRGETSNSHTTPHPEVKGMRNYLIHTFPNTNILVGNIELDVFQIFVIVISTILTSIG